MPKVRNFVLLAVCLAFVWAFTAPAIVLAGNSLATVQGNDTEELTYFKQVIAPALNAGTLSEEQAIWMKRYAALNRNNPQDGDFRRDASGDDGGEFGYMWKDQDEDEVDFEWIDITQDVDPFDGVSDDWNSGFQDLGWTFNFYGEEYDAININSNGWISFVNDSYIYSLFDVGIPDANAPNGLICPFTTDLDISDAIEEDNPGVYFWTDPDNQVAIVTWQGMPEWDGENGFDPNPQTFQVILTMVGEVPFMKFQYNDENRIFVSTITIGIESPNGQMGMMAYWGVADDGEDDTYSINDAIVVTTLFPDDGPNFVNIPGEFDFGGISVNQDATIEGHLFNSGDADLTITGAVLNDETGAFSWDLEIPEDGLVLGSLTGSDYSLTFAPDETADYEASITITHDGVNDDGETTIMVYGTGADLAIIAVDPDGIDDEVESFDVHDHTVTISNEGGLELNWAAEVIIISEPEDAGPRRRDDRGDAIDEKVVNLDEGVNQYKSLAWDYDRDLLYVSSYYGYTITAYDVDANDAISQINGMTYCMEIAYLNGVVYGCYLGNSTIYRAGWDEDGELESLGTINFGGSGYGIAADYENNWLLIENSGNNYNIQIYEVEDNDLGDEVAQISGNDWRARVGNQYSYNLEWVPDHRDIGQLWIHYTTTCYQIHVDEDEWETVDMEDGYGSFQVQSTYYYEGMAHDGEDLWVTGYGYATAKAYDDGIKELHWLAFSPEEGTIEGGGSEDLTITLQPGSGLEGDYSADLILSSNDQGNPEVTIGITMAVVGKPAIAISWPAEFGYVDVYDEDYNAETDGTPVIDFNAMFDPNLFTGYDMKFPIEIANDGPVPLTIESIDFDGDPYFYVMDDNFEVAAFESAMMEVILNADDSDDWAGQMTVNSDATDKVVWSDPNWEIDMVGSTISPPIIDVNQNEIEDELAIGEGNTSDWELIISNYGDAPLNFEVDHEILSEPERDANVRGVRRAGPQRASNIRRDDRGELVDGKVVDLDEGVNIYKALAWDYENDLLIASSYTGYTLRAYDVEANDVVAGPANGLTYVMDIAYLEGVVYGCYNGSTQLWRYAFDGDEFESLGAANFNGSLYGIAADRENNLLFIENSSQNYQLEVWTMTDDHDLDEKIGAITNWRNYTGNSTGYNWEYVPAHRDVGQFWTHYQSTMYQILVDEEEWEAIDMEDDLRSFQVQSTYYYEGAAHDGHDLWVTGYGYSQAKAYDDGITEAYWFNYDLKEGTIEPGGDPITMTLTLNAQGLHEGTYEAELYFLSNDPSNDRWTVTVTLYTIGTPMLDAEWSAAHGFNDGVVDFNAAWDPNLFTGADYTVPVTFFNDGSRYTNVAFAGGGESGYFSADPAEFRVEAEADYDFNIVFHADLDDPGDFAEELIFEWDGEDSPLVINVSASATMPPIMRVEPDEIVAEDMVTGEVREEEIGIYNDGSSDLYWAAEIYIPDEEEGLARRDDRGQLVDGKVLNVLPGANSYKSLAYDTDNDYMLVSDYSNGNIRLYDVATGDLLQTVGGVGNCMDIDWNEGVYFVPGYGSTTVNRFVLDGDGELTSIGSFQGPGACYGIATDWENRWLFYENGSNNYNIYVYELTDNNTLGDLIGQISDYRNRQGGSTSYNLEWVPGHRDIGQLWIHYTTTCYQHRIDEDEWTTLAPLDGYGSFQVQSTYYYEGMSHDGHDLWVTGYGYAQAKAYDDGITEVYWLGLSPEEGIVEPDDMGVLTVVLDGRGISGDFYGEVWITSNDRAESGSVTVPVTVSITPVPDLVVDWEFFDKDDPDRPITWSDYYGGDVFVGGDYEVVVTLVNEGTADLTVTGMNSDEEGDALFTSDFGDNDVVLEPDESIDVSIWFRPTDNGEYGGEENPINMQFFSDDPLEETKEVAVHATAFYPPIISIDTDEIADELYTGDVVDYDVTVSNDGDAELHWWIEAEIIEEAGGRDADVRSVRRADSKSAHQLRRDDRGDLIDEKVLDVLPGVNAYKSLAYDIDNDYMLVSDYSAGSMRLYDVTDGELLQTVAGIGNCMDIDWNEGVYFVPGYGSTSINRFVLNGDGELESIGAIQGPGACYGIATDWENRWLFFENGSNNYNIHVYELDGDNDLGEQIGVINGNDWRARVNNQYSYNLEWVADHRDMGQLWIHYTSTCYQILVDEDEWTTVDIDDEFGTFQVQSTYYYEGMTHDGEDLWVTGYGYATAKAYDDGITEMRWLGFEPDEGWLAGGESEVVVVTINATGLYSGDYRAVLHFLSNDFENDDVELFIDINVTGVGRIMVEPGGPEEENPPVDFGITYIGYPQTRTVTLMNVGTDDLIIYDFLPAGDNNGEFDVTEEVIDALPILLYAADEGENEAQIEVIFDPEEEGEYSFVIEAYSTDPAWDDDNPYPITMTATALEPPTINIEENFIQLDLRVDETEEIELPVENIGGSELIYEVEIVMVDRGRDADVRSVRRAGDPVEALDVAGPQRHANFRRDDRGDEIDDKVVDLDEGVNQYKSLAWDYDNDYLLVSSYYGYTITAYDVDANEAVTQVNGMTYCMEIAYLNGVIYGCYLGNSTIYRATYDEDGNLEALGSLNFGGSGYGIAADWENNWIMIENSSNSYNIQIYEVTDDHELGDEVGQIGGNDWRARVGNQYSYNLEWVPDHRADGQLWIHYTTTCYQLLVDEDNWETVDIGDDFGSFQVQSTYYYEGMAHDGEDLWVTGYGYATAKAYDDGITESRWLTVDPMEGTIDANDEESIFLFFDAHGLYDGDYLATLVFHSNDPENPAVEVDIALTVEGFALWGTNLEEQRDQWMDGQMPMPFADDATLELPPAYVDDDAVGADTQVDIELVNAGSADLLVEEEDIEIDGDFYIMGDAVNGFSVPAYDVYVLSVGFNPGQLGEREGSLALYSNAENEELDGGPVSWNLFGIGQEIPEIWTSPEGGSDIVVRAGLGAEQIETVIEIGNREGEWRRDLMFEVDIEEIEQEEQGGMARRDDRGDLIDGKVVDLDEGINIYKALAWDYMNDLLIASSYTGYTLRAYDVEANDVVAGPINGLTYVMDIAYLEGVVYGCYNGGTQLWRYAFDGEEFENLGAANFNGSLYGIAADSENNRLFIENANQNYRLEVWSMTDDHDLDEMLGSIDNWRNYTNGSTGYNWEYVPKHLGIGQLWTHYQSTMYQILVDEEEWEAIDMEDDLGSFQVQSTYYYEGAAHDGHDLWVTGYGYSQAKAYDDGLTELYWIIPDIDEGTVAPDESVEVTLTLNTEGLEQFVEYEANVYISWNDAKDGEAPDSPVMFHVTLIPGARLQHFENIFKSDVVHTLHVDELTLNNGDGLPTGWEIGVANEDEEFAGAIVWQEGGVTLNAYGGFGGFANGDEFMFYIWDPESDREYPAEAKWAEDNEFEVFVSDAESWLTLNGIQVWDQTLNFNSSWSLVSMQIDLTSMYDPNRDDGPDMTDVLSVPIDDGEGDDDLLIDYVDVIKNWEGAFNLPQYGYQGIDVWDHGQGYWIKVSQAGISATWNGVPVGADAELLVRDGWNMLAYYPDYELPSSTASDFYVIQDLVEHEGFHVIIAKNDQGGFMVPDYRYSTMGNWKPGKGYQINIDMGGQEFFGFSYPAPYGQGVAADVTRDRTSHWTTPVSTGENMSILVKDISGIKLSPEDEIAAYNKVTGEIVGVGRYSDGMFGIPVWGDIKYDGSREVPSSTYDIVLRVWDKDNDVELTLKPSIFYEGSELRYTANDVVVMDAEIESYIPEVFDLSNNYPNPFNSVTRFNYDVPEDASINISVFDVAGRLVETLVSGEQTAGRHTMAWDATNVASGVYVVQMKAPSFNKVRKVMLVK